MDERVDHRSLEAQREEALERGDAWAAEALDRAPEDKLGPAANAMERRERAAAAEEGRDYVPVTERGTQVQAAREARGLVREMRERMERAREAWETARDDGHDRVRAARSAPGGGGAGEGRTGHTRRTGQGRRVGCPAGPRARQGSVRRARAVPG